MKKVRYIAGLAGIVPAVAGVITTTPAHATITSAGSAARNIPSAKAVRTLDPKAETATGVFTSIVGNSVNFHRRDGQTYLMYRGDTVEVTCYYSGAPLPDSIWDHVVWEFSLNHNTNHGNGWAYDGHVADSFVNFGGLTAKQFGLPHC